MRLGDLTKAEKAARKALALDPTSADAYRCLGDVYNMKKQGRSAVEMYEKCLARNANMSDVYINLGWAYEQVGDSVSARRNYEIYLKIAPKSPEAKQVREQIKKIEKQERTNIRL